MGAVGAAVGNVRCKVPLQRGLDRGLRQHRRDREQRRAGKHPAGFSLAMGGLVHVRSSRREEFYCLSEYF